LLALPTFQAAECAEDIFDHLDKAGDGNGNVSPAEMKAGLQKLHDFTGRDEDLVDYTNGLKSLLANFDSFFAQADVDGSGELEADEFKNAFVKLSAELGTDADGVCKLWAAYSHASLVYKEDETDLGTLFDDLVCDKGEGKQPKLEKMVFEAGLKGLKKQAPHAEKLQGTNFLEQLDKLMTKLDYIAGPGSGTGIVEYNKEEFKQIMTEMNFDKQHLLVIHAYAKARKRISVCNKTKGSD
jgi:hypothetical protein